MSIGLPVRDGEEHLEAAIRSILDQTFADFELIVSDNASSDGTEEIGLSFAELDERVTFRRSERNLGAAPNFNLTFQLSSGEYFKWAAHDDVLAPEFLARCVEVLDADPGVALAHSEVLFIDQDGSPIGRYDPPTARLDSPDRTERFADLVLRNHLCLDIFGLIRAETLRPTPLLGSYISSDRVLLAELGLRGRFGIVGEPFFRSRDHPGRSVRAIPFHLRGAWFDSANAGRRSFPHWRMLAEYSRALNRVPLSPRERRRCLLQLARWPTVNMNWARVLSDLIVGVDPRLAGALEKLKRRFYHGARGWDEVGESRG